MPPFTHFYSDPHFGHANIIQFANRPFKDLAEMNAALEANYASVVYDDDHVLWTGDCAWGGYDLAALLKRLPGRKSLVIGNHDKSRRRMLELGFELVADELFFQMGPQFVEVRHYPPRHAAPPDDPKHGHVYHRDNAADRFIHGHTHEPGQAYGRRVHVGVDAWDYAPATWADVAALMS